MTKKESIQMEKRVARDLLLGMLDEGSRVYTILNSVSKSGMSRSITLVIVHPKHGEIWRISSYVAKVLGYKLDKHGALKVQGCGMDMGYHVVHSLSQSLFGDGYKLEHSWI